MFRSKRCRSRSCCLNSRDCVVAELPRWRLCTSAPAMVSVLAMQAWPLPPYGVCLSVCLSVMFVDGIATNKCIFRIVSPSGSNTILVCLYQTSWQYSDGYPLTGASNASGVGKSHDLSQYLAPSRAVNDLTAKCNLLSCDGPWQADDTIVAGKRRRLLTAGNDDEVFMTRSLSVTPKTTEQRLIVRSDKSEA